MFHFTSECVLQVFPPTFREMPPPSLELFDLDEQFSSEKVRVAQITNKCEYSVLTLLFVKLPNISVSEYRWFISSMIYSGDKPFWSESLDMSVHQSSVSAATKVFS